MKIAVIGKGRVGSELGPAFARAGHQVTYGVRDPAEPRYKGDDAIPLAATADAAAAADVIVLAVDWPAALDALDMCGDLAGKVLIDCTNPLRMGEKGLELALGFDDSAGEQVAARTAAKVVKTLNQVGSPVMGRAHDYDERPIQLVASDHDDAKRVASGLLEDIGFRPVDYGGLVNARKLEPLAMVWIDQAFKHAMEPTTAWFLKSV